MTTIATLNPTLYTQIKAIADAPEGVPQDYPGMYNSIAQGIRDGSIALPGGTNSSIYFWYSQAGAINANDTTTPSTAFIRNVATRGLQYDGKSATVSQINKISDAIAKKIAKDIVVGNGLPDFVTQLSNDIGQSIEVGGITLGGWGGSFYHWNDIYSQNGVEKKVGEWIMSTPGEYQKFLTVNAQAVADNAQMFPGLAGDQSFWASIKKVIENTLTDPLTTGFDAGVAYNQIIGRAVIELNIRGYSMLGDLIKQEFRDLEFGIYTGINQLEHAITGDVNNRVTQALNWVAPRRDPLVLDLDGNGITTSGINPSAPILFDQDGDGIKNATGWIASGEAIVVRDLNGNGTIDSGREIFGDNTILTTGPKAGQTAANGFEALADLDSNHYLFAIAYSANDVDFKLRA